MPHLYSSALPSIEHPEVELRRLVAQIPHGRVATYGQLAKALGSSSAAKWIAVWLTEVTSTAECPSHRVVRADGTLGNYRLRSAATQRIQLEAEGIQFVNDQLDLTLYGVTSFQSPAPLQALAEWQLKLAAQVSLTSTKSLRQRIESALAARDDTGSRDTTAPDVTPPDTTKRCRVAGVDVSYISPERAVAAYVLFDLRTGERLWSLTRDHPVTFPYISGFLALRELPILLPTLDEARAAGQLADIIMVDGHGTLHPRRLGIATHLGVATGLPTIGVGKTLSVGEVDLRHQQPGEPRPILSAGTQIGTAMKSPGGQKPVYYSPGHGLDLPTTDRIVQRLFHEHRLPDPTYWADRLSREAARAAQLPTSIEQPPDQPET